MDEISQVSATNLASTLQLRDRELEAKTIEMQKRMEESLNQARAAMEVRLVDLQTARTTTNLGNRQTRRGNLLIWSGAMQVGGKM